jgi:hypothetical protein
LTAAALASCAGDPTPRASTPSTPSLPPPTAPDPAPALAAVSSTTATTTAVTSTTAVPAVAFRAAVQRIDDATAARMTWSWRPGCPVGLDQLRLLSLSHWSDDGAVHQGELVVAAEHADAVVAAFRRLFEVRFPIARMELVDVYQGDDQQSMRANNTSAFNCREIDGSPGVWSQHAYGGAVDINPLVNPWVRGSTVDPPEGRPYADRRTRVAGGIYAGDEVVAAFAAVGWSWGGAWSSGRDYQHFSANGR